MYDLIESYELSKEQLMKRIRELNAMRRNSVSKCEAARLLDRIKLLYLESHELLCMIEEIKKH